MRHRLVATSAPILPTGSGSASSSKTVNRTSWDPTHGCYWCFPSETLTEEELRPVRVAKRELETDFV